MSGKSTSRHIFLSYSRDDDSIMNRIRKELESEGMSVWTDEGLIPGTESWKSDIERAICEALGIVVILSPGAKQSLWVERELDFARVHGIRIFPILVHGEPSNAIPIELINAQWIDIRKEADFSAEMRNLVLALQGGPGHRRDCIEHEEPGPPLTLPVAKSAIIIAVCIILSVTVTAVLGPRVVEYIGGNGTNTPTQEEIVASTPEESSTPKTPIATSPSTMEVPKQTETSTPTEPIEATTEIPTRTKTPTIFPTFTRTPQWGFQDNCIYSPLWTTYPDELSMTDSRDCIMASDLGLDSQDQGLAISVQNPESDERYGIYSPVDGDVLIEFNIRIDRLETRVDDELVSLGLGIISLNPINTETDSFIYYVIESPSVSFVQRT